MSTAIQELQAKVTSLQKDNWGLSEALREAKKETANMASLKNEVTRQQAALTAMKGQRQSSTERAVKKAVQKEREKWVRKTQAVMDTLEAIHKKTDRLLQKKKENKT